jgi:hypothetical protein
MNTDTLLNPHMISLLDNLDKNDRESTIKRLCDVMNSSSSSKDQSPKILMEFAFNNSDTVDNKFNNLNMKLENKEDNLIIRPKMT